ncbi:speedy protein E4-like [Suricata suricatta]|uniref:speedy protein E4-like n=1 Tax=Suricata suricatta TaxID=37032 RepID=UPI00115568D2|nr:speedy protein E4-like [Suricata suricatta]
MASSEPGSQSEEQSPQSSTSAQYPLEVVVVVNQETPGPSAPRVGPHSLPPSHGWKRRREESDEEEEEEEKEEETAPQAEDTWVVDSLYGLKMKLKRRRVSSVLTEHHEVFTRLLEDPVIKKFLAWDKHLRLSDKYLLSMVIAYFSRAGLFSWQYQQIHFFIALYLASDMEEDNQAPKQAIFSFLYGRNRFQRPLFHKLRFQFLRSMRWRTRVTREECEEIQAFDPELWVWGRDRTLLPEESARTMEA